MKVLSYPEIHELTLKAQSGDKDALLSLASYAIDATSQLVFLDRQIASLKENFDRLDLIPKQD